MNRPDPDALLARVQSETPTRARGKLKIFLGYAAGVGKTYAMLQAARQLTRQAQAVDVVVAYAETHGRQETDALLEGLEILPRKTIEYRGVTLSDMDLDAVLARKPQLALVDELAHTNAEGMRHPKRVQDVLEILDAGIDVYTTLNIQHLESLNDVVAQITGVYVRETLPDSILDAADDIELIDLPPDELLTRLRDGKVYVPEQAQRALNKFFRQGNLTALREMALRRAAMRVDDQMRDYMRTRAIPGPWAAGERLLVAVSASALSEKLVRRARHLADELNAQWFVVFVETREQLRLSQAQQDQLARTLALAQELGAQTQTLAADEIVPALMDFARAHNITKIIAGKPLRPRWQEFLRGSLVHQLIRASGEIDVYVISAQAEPAAQPLRASWRPHAPFIRYLYAALLIAAATILGVLTDPFISATNLVMFFLLAVVVAALFLGRGPSVFASILGVLAFDFLFVLPLLTFAVNDAEYLLTFIALFMVGLVVSHLTVRVREQADAARQREQDNATLYALSRDLAVAADDKDILRALKTNAALVFDRRVMILLPEKTGQDLTPIADDNSELAENEYAVALWAYEHGQTAGRDTDTLPAAKMRFVPLKTARGILGVIGVTRNDESKPLSPSQRRMFDTFASLVATAIERIQLADAARQAQVRQATEELQNALLNSISHDLRTPLVSITGALTSLQEDAALDDATRHALIENARGETERLNRLVGNLLDMTRVEAGALHLRLEPSDMQDAIGSALEQLERRAQGREIRVQLPEDLPLVPMDFTLIVQVLVNLIDNALKYSQAPIEIRAHAQSAQIQVQVMDRGIGIPVEALPHIFDRLYRVQRPEMVSGTGMGLAICKGIVEAHGGTITAENRLGGGTLMTFTLPLKNISDAEKRG
jgi:two-component system sensor histidine kinase KdpD